jgi:hypothetical protein
MTEDRDDKKLHPLGTFSHCGVEHKSELIYEKSNNL